MPAATLPKDSSIPKADLHQDGISLGASDADSLGLATSATATIVDTRSEVWYQAFDLLAGQGK
jgi:hypothetical protein